MKIQEIFYYEHSGTHCVKKRYRVKQKGEHPAFSNIDASKLPDGIDYGSSTIVVGLNNHIPNHPAFSIRVPFYGKHPCYTYYAIENVSAAPQELYDMCMKEYKRYQLTYFKAKEDLGID